jgi:hypothetical protein
MPSWQLDITGGVKLDGSGNGTVQVGPQSGQRWDVTSTTVSTGSQSSPLPQCSIYSGPTAGPPWLLDATFTGNGDQTDTPSTIYNGQYVWAVWTGGNPGDGATVRVQGTVTNKYRAG